MYKIAPRLHAHTGGSDAIADAYPSIVRKQHFFGGRVVFDRLSTADRIVGSTVKSCGLWRNGNTLHMCTSLIGEKCFLANLELGFTATLGNADLPCFLRFCLVTFSDLAPFMV